MEPTTNTVVGQSVGELRSSPAFAPSTYQKDIFEHIKAADDAGDGIVCAVAGSGKTTTLVEGARLLGDKSALFVAFNKHIAETLAERLSGTRMVASTIHAAGRRSVADHLKQFRRYPDVKGGKYVFIAKDALAGSASGGWSEENKWLRNEIGRMKPGEARKCQTLLTDLVDMARLTLSRTEEEIASMIERRNIDTGKLSEEQIAAVVQMVRPIINQGIADAERTGRIDFTDMIFMPVALDLRVEQYERLFVDEAQDLNACQQQFVYRCRRDGGRALFVGDPNQAIMAFAGADGQSFWNIKEHTGATQLPLSVCYRCPTSHLDIARSLVPQIENRPGAIEGVLERRKAGSIVTGTQHGDLILCRKKAPLVPLCIRLIRNRVAARVRGRDIGKMLTDKARDISNGAPWSEFLAHLEMYRAMMLDRYMKKENPPQGLIDEINDVCEALEACYTGFAANSLEAFCQEIEGIFADEGASVWLSTIHKAKGLEAERVFILDYDKLPYSFNNQSDEEAQQELNLKYVAVTRAKAAMFLIEPD